MINIQERTESINKVIRDIADFIQNNKDIKDDFNEYLKTIGQNSKNGVPFQTACFSYILEAAAQCAFLIFHHLFHRDQAILF